MGTTVRTQILYVPTKSTPWQIGFSQDHAHFVGGSSRTWFLSSTLLTLYLLINSRLVFYRMRYFCRHLKVQSAPLCRELCAISVAEIEGERFWWSDCQLWISLHREITIRVLATDLSSFLSRSKSFFVVGRTWSSESFSQGHCSPTSTFDYEEQAIEYLDPADLFSSKPSSF
jgi:hypothetical protein